MSVDQPEAVVENLRQERLNVQKKTFTKWANIHLQKHGLQIDDIFQDLGDGLRLMKLLESLTGEKLGKPARGSSRINKIENVSRCLAFLHSKKMRLLNISSEDIVDGKPHLILGLLWTIILKCEIVEHQENVKSSEGDAVIIPEPQDQRHLPVQKDAKESLLLWCQSRTNGYPGVRVSNFHRSWRNGLAFNALLHSYLPGLVDFNSLQPHEHIYNLKNAFQVAEKHIGVPRLLDPEDVDTDKPDEKSIIIYVSTFSRGLASAQNIITSGKRITKILIKRDEIDKMKEEYNRKSLDLIDWIHSKVDDFQFMDPLESMENIQQEIHKIKEYRIKEKPIRNDQKNEIEALLFAIQMQRLGRAGWNPSEEMSPAEIERAWGELERAEHEHELQFRNQLKEQERLENLAYKFKSKRAVRESYLKDMQRILMDPKYGTNIRQADATFKKHEGIRTGIVSREIMVKDLFKVADTLINANYREKDDIIEWKKEIEDNWNYLLRLLEAYDDKFAHLRRVMNILEEMDSILEEINHIEAELDSESEPVNVEISLQNQALKEVQVASWGEAIRRLDVKIASQEETKDTTILQNQLSKLHQAHQSLVEVSAIRREALEDILKRNQQAESAEEMMSWILEKKLYCDSELNCKDLSSAIILQKNHKSLGSELQHRKELSEDMTDERLKREFAILEQSWKRKGDQIDFAIKAYQYSADADECDSWISEKLHILSGLDCGSNEQTCEALLRRHVHVQSDITTHITEVNRLRREADVICQGFKDQQNNLLEPMSASQPFMDPSEGVSLHHKLTKADIYDRQYQIENSFSELQRKCEERKKCLYHSSMYFQLADLYEELEKWMREKEEIVDSNDFSKEVDEAEKIFESFIMDLAAHGLMIDQLKNLAETLESEKAEQAPSGRILFDAAYRRWQHLHDLTRVKGKNVKGFTSLILARRICDETTAWLSEKCKTEGPEIVEDIRSLDVLRRRQEAVERKLVPAEERVKQAHSLVENVITSYPDQTESIQIKIGALDEQFESYKESIKETIRKMEESAGLQIFKRSVNSLLEWSNLMIRKINVREKIVDKQVAENVAKEHQILGEEITTQSERFEEVEKLGENCLENHEDIRPLLEQLQESRQTVYDLWQEKQMWLQQSLDLQIFNREADQLNSVCSSHDTLLDSASVGETLSDVEIMIRHHDAFIDTLKAQENRFLAFEQMANTLISAGHSNNEYIREKCELVLQHRENVKEKVEMRKFLLLEAYEFQEFKADAHELSTWIAEKSRLASDLMKQDPTTHLSYKMKRQKTLEAEIAANQDRLQTLSTRGQSIIGQEPNEYTYSVESTLENLNKEWNLLCDSIESNQQTLQEEIELRNFNRNVESVMKKLDDISRALVSSNFGKDLRSVKSFLKNMEVLEAERDMTQTKITNLIHKGDELVQAKFGEKTVRKLIAEMQQRSDSLEQPFLEKREKLETCLKFYEFKSDVDRELLWISDQMTLLSTLTTTCKNLLDAQKFHKKIENLEGSISSHKVAMDNLQEKVLSLVTEEECPVDVTQPCLKMKQDMTQLLQEFSIQKEKALSVLKAQSFLCEAGEMDSWINEKIDMLSNTDYGKDEDAVIKLLTKHKTLELEIDSYKGLVADLATQAESLVESNHPDSKMFNNRMEVINQEMKNIEKLCSVKRQKLLESKSRHEFENESNELKLWINEQMVEATSEDFGEDYEHVLVLHQNFEFFRAKVEGGSKRIIQFEDFAKRLITSNCYFIKDVEDSLEYLSDHWSQLVESIEARSFKMEAAAEIHRYHRDVTDTLSRIHSYYRIIPQDLGNNRSHVQDLINKHDKIESELLGLEAQVHLLLEDSQRLQETYPGGNEEHIQMQLALVVENWNLLQQKVSNRKIQLLAAERIHKFLYLVREEESWAREMRLDLESEALARNVQQMETDNKAVELEIETRFDHFQPLFEEGESLLSHEILQPQIEEKLKSLSDIQIRVREAWNKRSTFIQRKKNVFLFFHEAKQIQASYSNKVQFCGIDNKETVEDLEIALKKHTEFQKSMDIQEEKFVSWKEQGKTLLKDRNEESENIQKKLDDLIERRTFLLDFSSERSKSLSDALEHAKFKRDTIEAEAWIQEKKNKLRLVLKGYNQLSDEEKIKCLQKQQSVQAELDAHEPFITSIVEQSKKVAGQQDVKMRLQLILEDWEEVKENAARIGNDLLQARDMLLIHDLFETTDHWIKQKELMIQANEVGKDYEHCLTLQAKLDDNYTDAKVDESLLQKMKELAFKLARNEDQKGVYVRYERIWEKWTWLKEEIGLYRRKLKDATQVHAFVKDVDDTIERIREKILVLSTREESSELSVVKMMQRKLELVQRDLTALDDKIREQEHEADILEDRHPSSTGRIRDKMNQVQQERSALDIELKDKKQYMDTAYTSLKFIKDINDFAVIVHEMVTEIEFGEVPSNSTDAQSLLRAHSDLQTQVVERQKEIKEFEESGKRILRLPGVSKNGIENSLKMLQEMHNDLDVVWENRLKTLLQCRDLQLFMEKTKQVENWLSAKEAFLANQDIGDSMSSVEALIRKHDNFEEIFLTNVDRIQEVEMMTLDLKDHEDFQLIQSRCEEICRRRDVLQKTCERRKYVLQDAKSLQQLLLEMYEISNWMNEKIRVASDDSYRDLTNLLSKTQKHAAFEAEILANHSRVVDFTEQAEKLLEEDHFASVEIRQHVENLESRWEELMGATNLRKERLQEAYEALQFKHKLEDINSWLEESESQMEFEELDSNVPALQLEISKNKELEKEAESYSENLRLLGNIADEFQQRNHFSKNEIVSQYKETVQRFRSLEDALQVKGTQLQESLLLARLDNDINDELSWIEESINICCSDNQINDVMTVQVLLKKLQALETEISSREPLISSVVGRCLKSNNEIAANKVQHLEERFNFLKDSMSLRRLRLADAFEAQTYYFEAAQVEMWMKEKLTQVVGFDTDRDVYSVQDAQKKLSTVEAATDGFRQSIQTLQELSSSLIGRGHFDEQRIQQKQEEVNDLFEELRQNILKKTAVLREKEDFFLFERDVKIMILQLKALSNISNTTDHGRDVEHVESLLQKFEVFGNRIRSHEASVQALQDRGAAFLEEGHTEFENVDELLQDLEATWFKCEKSAHSRYKALEQEKSVHSFYKSLDETLSWMHEKDVALSSEDYGHDLESIKTLLRHHDTLEGDLKAIQEQVQALEEESAELSIQFPDSKEEITEKYQTVAISWKKCTEKAISRKDKLVQAEQLQCYFDEARDFHAWIYEMSAVLTSSEMPEDVATSEELLAQHEGFKSEIDARFRSFSLFEARGQEIIAGGHFLSQDVQTKVDALSAALKDLLDTWGSRRNIYQQSLDLQLFKKKLKELESWLGSQEHKLLEENGRSIEEVDFLIQRHEQFEKKLELYEAKFQELQELTKAEEENIRHKEIEEMKRIENEKVLEQRKLEEIKRREEERLIEERKMERTVTELQQPDDMDDDYLPPDSSPLKRIGSRLSYKSIKLSYKEQAPPSRPTTPPIIDSPSRWPSTNNVQLPPFIPSERAVPPARAEGFLSRKQEMESGRKRSSSRQWKTLYTVLCGHLLCFFKDKKAFLESRSAKPPVNILRARCFIPTDYHKKKYVFRLELSDNAVFLFEAPNEIKKQEWMQKITFTSSLPPSQQLMTPAEERQFATVLDETQPNTIIEEDSYTSGDERLNESASQDYPVSASSKTYRHYSSPDVFDVEPIYGPGLVESGYENQNEYEDPFEESGRSFSITSNDLNPHSASSSVSNQSFVTAAASTGSMSTLQDERAGEIESSEDESPYADTTSHASYRVPHPTPQGSFASFEDPNITPRGSFNTDETSYEKSAMPKSSTLPARSNPPDTKKGVTKSESKRKSLWKVLSLRRK